MTAPEALPVKEVGLDGAATGEVVAMDAAAASQPRLLNSTILFVDLMDSVKLSNSMTLWEYNTLINEYQDVLRRVLESIKAQYPVGEHYIGGDQLAIFFYDEEDVAKEVELEAARRRGEHDLAADLAKAIDTKVKRALYAALRCAVAIKNAWVSNWRNMERVSSQQPVLDLGIGINTGQVILQRRGDERQRIEGYAINYAKRVEGFARHGRHCRIMLSKRSFELFRQTIAAHTMLKQRASFEAYEPQTGQLKGLQQGTRVYELKFFHRLQGFNIPQEQVPLFAEIFHGDPTNLWAYVNLVNYYLHVTKEWNKALDVAWSALHTNSQNEKIYYDLALISFEKEDYSNALEYAQRCLRINDQMDMAYDLLADIAEKDGRWSDVLKLRSQALSLAPQSAGYVLDIARALAQLNRGEDAMRYYGRALMLYDGIAESFPETCQEIERLILFGPTASAPA